MSHHDYSLEDLSDISPYENYISAIRDTVTKKKYAGMEKESNKKWKIETIIKIAVPITVALIGVGFFVL